MTNSAAAVRDMGIQKVPLLMQKFGYQFAKEYLMKEAEKVYNQDKCPFHFRISCLRTIGAIWVGRDKDGNRFQTQALNGDETQTLIKQCMPLWQKAFRDSVANVKFVMCKIALDLKNCQGIDWKYFQGELNEIKDDADRDVCFYANMAM